MWNFPSKIALDFAGDAYPGSEPGSTAERQHVNDSFGHEDERHDDKPVTEYNFFYANGELDVDGQADHDKMRDRMHVNPEHSGPMAVGSVSIQDSVAIWEINSNIAGSALAKELQKYTRQAGWSWGGMVDQGGDPVGTDEKLARIKDNVTGKVIAVAINGKIARARPSEAVREWAKDFGYKLAEYPGGGSMTDPTMMKNHSPLGEDLELHNLYDPNTDPNKDRDRMPGGHFKCPDCGRLFGRWPAYMLHRRSELPSPDDQPDGKFPEVNEVGFQDMIQEPGIHTGGWQFTAVKAPKDMFSEAIPFLYDVEKDAIFVGAPGTRHSDIELGFTPGALVEGEYQKGGKVMIKSRSDAMYSVRHMLDLWYYQHPEFEVTSVDIVGLDGNTHRLAHASTGAYIVGLAAQDPAVHSAWQALREAGGRVYVVGGAVRDAILHKEPKDIDLMVAGIPADQVNKALSELPGKVDVTGKDFGVFRYNYHGHEVEIAMPRTEKSTGTRRVDFDVQVDHNLPVEKDLERRDFTANAIAVDLADGRVVDPYNGVQDIQGGHLRTVHPDSFSEDPTRLVRALVAHSRHHLIPDEKTHKEMKDNAHALGGESAERIQAELDKLMSSDNPAQAIRLAHNTGVLEHILPEVDACFGFDQKNPHHEHELGTHLLNVLEHTANNTKDPDVRFAALMHDIGKPKSQWINPDTGNGHYYYNDELDIGANHEEVGATMASDRMKALRFPAARTKRVHDLVSHHMYPDFSGEKGARKFLNRVGEHADDLFTLREADRAGKGTPEHQALKTPVDVQRELVQGVKEKKEPTQKSDLAINGNDIQGLGIKPGPIIGDILNQLTNMVVEQPELNNKATLLNHVRQELAGQ